jgi:putrescine transport system ATP-binding protein
VLWWAIRPEKITLSRERPEPEYPDANVTHGVVEDVVYLGDMSVFQVVLESGKKLRVTKANAQRGDPDAISWDEPVWASWGGNSGSVLTS